MDFKDLLKKWTDHTKVLKKENPNEKDLLTEAESVYGALARLEVEAEKASETMRKSLVPVVAAAEKAQKEAGSFVDAAKKAGVAPLLGDVTDDDLQDFMKAIKQFRLEIAKVLTE